MPRAVATLLFPWVRKRPCRSRAHSRRTARRRRLAWRDGAGPGRCAAGEAPAAEDERRHPVAGSPLADLEPAAPEGPELEAPLGVDGADQPHAAVAGVDHRADGDPSRAVEAAEPRPVRTPDQHLAATRGDDDGAADHRRGHAADDVLRGDRVRHRRAASPARRWRRRRLAEASANSYAPMSGAPPRRTRATGRIGPPSRASAPPRRSSASRRRAQVAGRGVAEERLRSAGCRDQASRPARALSGSSSTRRSSPCRASSRRCRGTRPAPACSRASPRLLRPRSECRSPAGSARPRSRCAASRRRRRPTRAASGPRFPPWCRRCERRCPAAAFRRATQRSLRRRHRRRRAAGPPRSRLPGSGRRGHAPWPPARDGGGRRPP